MSSEISSDFVSDIITDIFNGDKRELTYLEGDFDETANLIIGLWRYHRIVISKDHNKLPFSETEKSDALNMYSQNIKLYDRLVNEVFIPIMNNGINSTFLMICTNSGKILMINKDTNDSFKIIIFVLDDENIDILRSDLIDQECFGKQLLFYTHLT